MRVVDGRDRHPHPRPQAHPAHRVRVPACSSSLDVLRLTFSPLVRVVPPRPGSPGRSASWASSCVIVLGSAGAPCARVCRQRRSRAACSTWARSSRPRSRSTSRAASSSCSGASRLALLPATAQDRLADVARRPLVPPGLPAACTRRCRTSTSSARPPASGTFRRTSSRSPTRPRSSADSSPASASSHLPQASAERPTLTSLLLCAPQLRRQGRPREPAAARVLPGRHHDVHLANLPDPRPAYHLFVHLRHVVRRVRLALQPGSRSARRGTSTFRLPTAADPRG